MTKGLKNTENEIIVVNEYELRFSSKHYDMNEINISASMYKDAQHALRDQNGTLTEWDFNIKRKSWNVTDPLTKMTDVPTLPQGEAFHEAIYDFVLSKLGAGWTKI